MKGPREKSPGRPNAPPPWRRRVDRSGGRGEGQARAACACACVCVLNGVSTACGLSGEGRQKKKSNRAVSPERANAFRAAAPRGGKGGAPSARGTKRVISIAIGRAPRAGKRSVLGAVRRLGEVWVFSCWGAKPHRIVAKTRLAAARGAAHTHARRGRGGFEKCAGTHARTKRVRRWRRRVKKGDREGTPPLTRLKGGGG